MNVSMIRRVASHIRNLDESAGQRFDMARWHKKNECGTRACVAGWAIEVHCRDSDDPAAAWEKMFYRSTPGAAADIFGLPGERSAAALFMPQTIAHPPDAIHILPYNKIDKKRASAVLYDLASWAEANPKAAEEDREVSDVILGLWATKQIIAEV